MIIYVEPTELPNRYYRQPPPYLYHPELFPELAVNNPDYIPFTKQIIKKHEKFPVPSENKGKAIGQNNSKIEIPEDYVAMKDFSETNEENAKKFLEDIFGSKIEENENEMQ